MFVCLAEALVLVLLALPRCVPTLIHDSISTAISLSPTSDQQATADNNHMRDKILKMIHQNCRRGFYPKSNTSRFQIPDESVPWSVDLPDYEPANYSSPSIEGQPWADPDLKDPGFKPKWNEIDGEYDLRIT